MASAFTVLDQGLGSQPETEARSRQGEHQILATRAVVSDKALPFYFAKKNSHKMESSETSEVFIRRKRSPVRVGRHRSKLRERKSLSSHPCGSLNYFYGAFLLGFLWLTSLISQSMFGIAQDSPMYAHASLSQDGSHRGDSWVEHFLTSLLGPPRSLSGHVWSGRSLDFKEEKHVFSG